jgi:ABC-2 type transport system permease protein
MRGLIKNELLKLSRKTKLYIVIGFLALVSALQCYLIYTEIIARTPERIIAENERLIEATKNITIIQTGGDDGDTNFADIYITNTIEAAKKEIERAQRKLDNAGMDWHLTVRDEIASYEAAKEKAIAEGNLEYQEYYDTKIKILNYYLEHDMKPEEEYIMNNSVITDIITYISGIFLAVIAMILTVETIAGENSPATIKLLLTKPVSRGRIYISKFLTSLFATLGIVIAIELITYLALGLIFDFGNLAAPVPIGPKYMPDPLRAAGYGMGVKPIPGSTVLVPLWQKLLLVLALQIIFIITVVSFGMFISAIMKNGISAIIFGLLITAILTAITLQMNEFGHIKAMGTVMPFLFSTYSVSELILTGDLSSALNSTIISVPLAISVMTVWAAMFLLAGYRYFIKKDVLV